MKKQMRVLLAIGLAAAMMAGCSGTEKAPAETEKQTEKTQEQEQTNSTKETTAADKKPDKVYTVKISTQNSETTPMVQSMHQLADSLKEKSGGRLNVEVYPSGVLGSDEDLIEQAMQGVNVVVLTDASRMSNYVPDMAVFGMSYFIDNYDEALAVTKTDIYAEWTRALSEENGIHLFSFNWFAGPRYSFINKEAKVPADFKGIRMRTGGGSAYFEGVTGLGATPVNMPLNETYSALSSKAIDGCEGTAIAAVSNRYFEVCSHCVLTEHFQLINGLMCGEEWFKTLPEDLQELISSEIEAYGIVESKMAQEETQKALEELKNQGMTLVEIDKTPFIEASNAGYEKLGLSELRKEIYTQSGK